MAREFSRARRVEQQIQRELAQLLQFERKDPRLAWVTVVDVRLTPDLSLATIYVSVLGKAGSDAAEVVPVLNQAAGYFRTELGRRMKLRTTPQLRFFYDEVEDEARRVDDLLRQVKDDLTEGPDTL